jgi:hypothetical protein
MELLPCKIDWKKYQAEFPSQVASWVLPMAAKFPDAALGEMHDSYSQVYEQLAKHLPQATRKALGLFVAATSCSYVDSVDFDFFQSTVDYDPEEFTEVPQPHLDPRRMTRVAKALESTDYASQVRSAWQKVGAGKMTGLRMESADDFLDYLALWIRAFKEVRSEGAVLGFIVA